MTRSVLRPALFALAAAVALGCAGRVAIHAGYALPHGDALAAAGRAFVALGAPWLAVAWASARAPDVAGTARPPGRPRRARPPARGYRPTVPPAGAGPASPPRRGP